MFQKLLRVFWNITKTAIDVVVCVFEEIGAAGIFENAILDIIEAAVTGQLLMLYCVPLSK